MGIGIGAMLLVMLFLLMGLFVVSVYLTFRQTKLRPKEDDS